MFLIDFSIFFFKNTKLFQKKKKSVYEHDCACVHIPNQYQSYKNLLIRNLTFLSNTGQSLELPLSLLPLPGLPSPLQWPHLRRQIHLLYWLSRSVRAVTRARAWKKPWRTSWAISPKTSSALTPCVRCSWTIRWSIWTAPTTFARFQVVRGKLFLFL